MTHWTDPYIGLPYVEGEGDCAALAVRVQREVFGREIVLPTTHACGVRAQTVQIAALRDDYAERLPAPVEGCGVLMQCRGRFSHIGLFAAIGGEGWVLHAMQNARMVVLHRVRDLPRHGLALEGYYAWR